MTVICWFRRVLRLDDHPALVAAAQAGPVIPLVILDPGEAQAHPASAQRQAMALPALADSLKRQGSRLIIRRGSPAQVLAALIQETGATAIHSSAGFPFASDEGLAEATLQAGARLHLHPLGDLVPRGLLRTGQGGAYKVFTPYWRALRAGQITSPLLAPRLTPPPEWPASDGVDWPEARASMCRGWDVMARHIHAGEPAVLHRLDMFLEDGLRDYRTARDLPWKAGCSGLSDALAVGEISARRIWQRAQAAWHEGRQGAEDFLRELGWREFARDLFHADPAMAQRSWRPEWTTFPWKGDSPQAEAWRRGQTGMAMVDAGLRELFATGRMHNRVRMITASYLTKHLLTDWRIGQAWFAQTLTDWDPASNAMNWQWVAGCGPDASPYFRIFNPETQATKFDARGQYRDHWLRFDAVGAGDFAAAAPLSWQIDLHRRPMPAISLAQGRARALTAYEDFKRLTG